MMLPFGSPAFAASICARASVTLLSKKFKPRMNFIPVASCSLPSACHTRGSGTVTCLSVLPPPTRKTSGPLPNDCSCLIIDRYCGTSDSLHGGEEQRCSMQATAGSYCSDDAVTAVAVCLHLAASDCRYQARSEVRNLLFYVGPFMTEAHERLRNGVAWLVDICQCCGGERAWQSRV